MSIWGSSGVAMTRHDFTCHGKQVLRDGEHFADARDLDAAKVIASALNGDFSNAAMDGTVHKIAAYLDREAGKTPRARLRSRTLRVAASNVRAGLFEENENG